MVDLGTPHARPPGNGGYGVKGDALHRPSTPFPNQHARNPIAYEQFKKEAPISSAMQEILRNVESSPVSIVQASTGAGKSLLVPLALKEAGYSVVSTQPRILAAKSLADFSSRLTGNVLGDVIGYETALHTCPVSGAALEWTPEHLKEIKSATGYLLAEKDPKIYKLINYADSFTAWPSGGKAQLIYMEEIEGGILEVFAVDESFGAKVVVCWKKH